ncbi:MAG: hypothetical protein K0R92_3683 [Lachnospiraceae bacterium]|nr:hypothetical protein [Lachnospiraceae bacterium]
MNKKMYKKSAISMSFHEIGGLILLGVFVIHVLINWKWVVAITKKLFHKSIPVKTKIGYILNILLLISFTLIGISGIFISKVVFQISNEGSMIWKIIHYTASAAALIFIGIHLGLHQQFISGMLKKIFHIPQKAGKIIGLTVTAIVFAFGCFSILTTDFSNWLLMPLGVQQMNGGPEKGEFKEKDPIEKEERMKPKMPQMQRNQQKLRIFLRDGVYRKVGSKREVLGM